MKQQKKAVAVLLVTVIMFSSFWGYTAFAANFPDDVPEGHWAFNSIGKVTNLGLMNGETVTRFGISNLIDKFEVSRILAMLAGYKPTGATYEETVHYEHLLEKHIGTITEYSQLFVRWKHDFDMPIAYLLEYGVFTPLDLGLFMAIQDDTERYLALRRYEICLYFIRLLDAEEMARSFVPSEMFTDDDEIPTAIKPYIYYARHIGLIAGDGNGNFNPQGGVVKSAMAVMLDLMMDMLSFSGDTPTPAAQIPHQSDSYETLMGQIQEVYPSFKAITVRNAFNGEQKMFTLLPNASVMVNGEAGFFERLQVGMNVAGVLAGDDIIELAAMSQTHVIQEAPPAQISSLPDNTAMHETEIEGIVRGTKLTNGLPYIDLDVRLVNTRGEIIEETRTFLIGDNCVITRGVTVIDYLSINPGDVATLTVTGTAAINIYVEEKHRNITGTVTEKREAATTGMGIIAVKDANGRIHDLVTTDKSSISRSGHIGVPTWRDIRIGDNVEVSAEFSQILSITAEGTRIFKDIVVTGISISMTGATVSGMENGREITYPIIPSAGVNIYNLRVGSQVRLTLDSMEIENILLLEDAHANDITGFIRSISGNRIIVQSATDSTDYKTLILSNATIIDAVSGAWFNPSDLTHDMRVYIVFDGSIEPHYITSLTILAY